MSRTQETGASFPLGHLALCPFIGHHSVTSLSLSAYLLSLSLLPVKTENPLAVLVTGPHHVVVSGAVETQVPSVSSTVGSEQKVSSQLPWFSI